MKYDLVFEGGGAKGMVFVGAMNEFFAREHTFGRLLGTSAGAITAALLAVGYDAAEMAEALSEKDENDVPVFAKFMGTPPPMTPSEIQASDIRAILSGVNSRLIPDFIEDRMDDMLTEFLAKRSQLLNLFAFVQRGGWYSAHAFIEWFSDKLDSGYFNGKRRNFSGMTLKQLNAITKVDLTVVAADITGERTLVLNHNTAPQCPVVAAVRMSMSIPLLWDEVIWQAEWGKYLKRTIAGNAVVDGGLLSSFPIELFVSDEPSVTRVMGTKVDRPILGCLIDESLHVNHAPKPPGEASEGGRLSKLGQLNTANRLKSLINTVTQARDKDVIDAFRHLVVYCPAKGYGTMEFDMSDARRNALIAAGKAAMETYLDSPPEPVSKGPFESFGDDNSAEIANRIARGILGE